MTDPTARTALEAALAEDPTDRDRWLVYLDFCGDQGAAVGSLTALIAAAEPTLQLAPAESGGLAVAIDDPDSGCTVTVTLTAQRTLTARWHRDHPPLDWLVPYPL